MARVLVVEDDALVRTSVHRVLEREGHEVWESSGARTALKMLTVVPVDVIITDIYMPEMNGLDLISQLCAWQQPNRHVIAMTGGGVMREAGDLLQDARRFGARATLEKPFGPRELSQAVDQVLAAA